MKIFIFRFHSLFPSGKDTRIHVVPGNHDMGFHYALSPYLDKRFKSAFNTKAVQLKVFNWIDTFLSFTGASFQVINKVPFVLINSMAFEGDDCFLCKPAVKALKALEQVKPTIDLSKNQERILTFNVFRNWMACLRLFFSRTSRCTGGLVYISKLAPIKNKLKRYS